MKKLISSIFFSAVVISTGVHASETNVLTQSTGKVVEPTLADSVLSKDTTITEKSLFSQSTKSTSHNVDKKESKTDSTNVIKKLTDIASSTVVKVHETGLASWYGRQFHGKKTASGEKFDMNEFTAAHRSLPLSCYIKVTNKDNGKSVVFKVNDRGPFSGKRVLDLSYAAAQSLGMTSRGVGNVIIERVTNPK